MFGFLAAPTLEAARSEIVARTAAKLWVSLATRMVQSAADYAGAFDAFRAEGAAGIMGSTIFSGDAPLCRSSRPSVDICEWAYMARAGCTLGFGPDLIGLRRLTGDYVARIFNGANPAGLPIQLSDRFTLAVNLRVAAQLKLQLPTVFLARADEVIE